MTFIEAVVLGIVQGLTKFIPISSSAHLIIVPWLFQWNDPAFTSLPFDVALHLGTLVAVLVFFANDWIRIFRAGIQSVIDRKIGNDPDRKLAWFLLIGSIPGGMADVLLESKINDWFHPPNTSIQSSAMIVMAIIIVLLVAICWLLVLCHQGSHHIHNDGEDRIRTSMKRDSLSDFRFITKSDG
ncbi:MAG: undecaprenyl-diphosphate phosphatase [Chloroflexota bacterium]